MKCKGCGFEIEVNSKNIKKTKGNPSYKVKCPSCGGWNNVKCRHKTGEKRTVKLSQIE